MGGNVFENIFITNWLARISKIFWIGFLSSKEIRKSSISIEIPLRYTTLRTNDNDRSSKLEWIMSFNESSLYSNSIFCESWARFSILSLKNKKVMVKSQIKM
jgi:hypothetical protein